MKRNRSLWLLFGCALFVIFWRLGARGLNEPDEGRCAGIAFEMFRSGDWLIPRLYDLAHFDKPPLLYWLTIAAFHVGGVNEFTARLPAALAGIGTLLLTFLTARRLFDEATALCAGFVLLSSPLFFAMSRLIDPNMLLTFWVTLSIWAAIAWFQDGKKGSLWIFYLAQAASFLTKGPIGLAIVALALLGYGLFTPPAFPRRNIWSPLPLLLAACAGLAWFVIVAVRYPELNKFFFHQEMYNRYFTQEHHRSQPFYFYLIMIPASVIPWAPSFLRALAKDFRAYRANWQARLLLAWLVLPTIMFSLAGSKMPTYILPLLPAIAILVARVLAAPETSRRFLAFQYGFILFFSIALPIVMMVHGRVSEGWASAWDPYLAFWLVPAACCAALGWTFAGPARVAASAGTIAFVMLFALELNLQHELEFGPHTTARGMARIIAPMLRPDDRIVLLERNPRGLSFYLHHPITIADYKFEIEIQSDRERAKNQLYHLPTDVYAWFDSTQHVFLVTHDEAIKNMEGAGHRKSREIYRDGRYVVVCNFLP